MIPQKNPGIRSRGILQQALRLGRSANRASLSACTALDAGIRIDFILAITFRNRVHGALSSTGTAGDALIRNLISHNSNLQSYSRLRAHRRIIHNIFEIAIVLEKNL